jgi:hypothetical protein
MESDLHEPGLAASGSVRARAASSGPSMRILEDEEGPLLAGFEDLADVESGDPDAEDAEPADQELDHDQARPAGHRSHDKPSNKEIQGQEPAGGG